jgi:O-acetyl-ADP-ribose deacetylase (regulator of RNase III)
MDDRSNELAIFEYSDGDIFSVPSDMLINPVNCKGVSGASLAKEFKEKFPVCQKRYEAACSQDVWITDPTGTRRKIAAFRPGDVLHFIDINVDKIQTSISEMTKEEVEELLLQRQHVVFFPTKNHWKNPSKYEYVEKGLKSLAKLLLQDGMEKVERVSIPALGCSLGGLVWEEVEAMVRKHLYHIPKTFILFPPK